MSGRDGIRDIRYGILDSAQGLTAPLLRRLHEDWHVAGSGGLPGHDFVDPVKLKYLLGQLLVIGVVRAAADSMRFHYRLIGTDLVDRHGRDATGNWMDEHDDPEVVRSGPPACRMSVEAARPVHLTGARMMYGERHPLEYLILPLANDGVIDRLLIAQLYLSNAPRRPYGSGL